MRRQDSRSKRRGDLARGQLVCYTVIAQEQCDIGLNRGRERERGRWRARWYPNREMIKVVF